MRVIQAIWNFIKKYVGLFLKGVVIGVAVIIPGVSGGTMAIVLGIYEKLLNSVNHFFKNVKENLAFLLVLAAGALLSVFSLSFAVSYMLANFPSATNFFFVGLILAGIPAVYKESGLNYRALFKAEQSKGSKALRILRDILPFICGAGVIIGIAFLQEDLVNLSGLDGAGGFFFKLAMGVLVAAALVLPGISGSHFLKMTGLYLPFVEAIKGLKILYLLPFGIGVLVGIILTAKLMSFLLKKCRRGTYLVILGFLLTSLVMLIIEYPPQGLTILFSIMALIGGVVLSVLIAMIAKVLKEKSGNTQVVLSDNLSENQNDAPTGDADLPEINTDDETPD